MIFASTCLRVCDFCFLAHAHATRIRAPRTRQPHAVCCVTFETPFEIHQLVLCFRHGAPPPPVPLNRDVTTNTIRPGRTQTIKGPLLGEFPILRFLPAAGTHPSTPLLQLEELAPPKIAITVDPSHPMFDSQQPTQWVLVNHEGVSFRSAAWCPVVSAGVVLGSLPHVLDPWAFQQVWAAAWRSCMSCSSRLIDVLQIHSRPALITFTVSVRSGGPCDWHLAIQPIGVSVDGLHVAFRQTASGMVRSQSEILISNCELC